MQIHEKKNVSHEGMSGKSEDPSLKENREVQNLRLLTVHKELL